MNDSVQQTALAALASLTVYKALSEEVQEEVKRIMRELDETEFGHDEWQQFSQASFAEEWNKPENAYWDIYLTNPILMDNNGQTEGPFTSPSKKEQAERVQQMEKVIAPLREPLPKDYKFDREEANER